MPSGRRSMPARATAARTWSASASKAVFHRAADALWAAPSLLAELASASARRLAWIIGQSGPPPYP
ncbi:hypothetical protein [Streptomyces sp. NPDC005336]|uniref:hypothetical protein n=1 Tax=Streptomyces sp. NPDC005336 TaxID=3157035 RepID=UPI0033A7A81A